MGTGGDGGAGRPVVVSPAEFALGQPEHRLAPGQPTVVGFQPRSRPRQIARAKRHTDVPVALGFGIGTPEQASDAADAGADGVIVGSRLVREAAEAADPAAAVRAVVTAMAEALR